MKHKSFMSCHLSIMNISQLVSIYKIQSEKIKPIRKDKKNKYKQESTQKLNLIIPKYLYFLNKIMLRQKQKLIFQLIFYHFNWEVIYFSLIKLLLVLISNFSQFYTNLIFIFANLNPATIIQQKIASFMNQNPQKSNRRRIPPRSERFSEKLHSPLGVDEVIRSPKIKKNGAQKIEMTNNNFLKNKSNKLLQLQSVQLQKLVNQIHFQNQKYHKEGRIQSARSTQALQNYSNSKVLPYSLKDLKSAIESARQQRKDLLQLQQTKSKANLHAAVANKQIQYAQKVKNSLVVQNNHLKSENTLLQKELAIAKDNIDRLKRQFQLELYQSKSQIQFHKGKINDLQRINKERQEVISQKQLLEIVLATSENEKKKLWDQNNRMRSQYEIVVKKNQDNQGNYKNVFENYTRLEIFCESLQRELAITKSYLSNTQVLNAQLKEDYYRLEQQYNKEKQEMKAFASFKNQEAVLLTKKNNELNLILQSRANKIQEIQYAFNEKVAQKQLTSKQLAVTYQKIADLQKQNLLYQQHIKALTLSYTEKQKQLTEIQGKCLLYYKTYGESQQEWAHLVKEQIYRINLENNQKIVSLSTEILEKEQLIKKLTSKQNDYQSSLIFLKQILAKKEEQLSNYNKQIKSSIERQNNLKIQKQKCQGKVKQLQKKEVESGARLNQLKFELQQRCKESVNAIRNRQADIIQIKENLKNKEYKLESLQNQSKRYEQQLQRALNGKELDSANMNIFKQRMKSLQRELAEQKNTNNHLNRVLTEKQNINAKNLLIINELHHTIVKITNQLSEEIKIKNQGIFKIQGLQKQIKSCQQSLDQKQNIIKNHQLLIYQLDEQTKQIGAKFITIQDENKKIIQEKLLLIKYVQEKQNENKVANHNIEQLEHQVQIFKNQQQENLSKLKSILKQREEMSHIIEVKTYLAENLKKTLIQMEENMRQSFQQSHKNQKISYESELQKHQNQHNQLQKKIQILNLYKVKCGQLQTQVLNLSIMLRNQSLNLQNQRVNNKNKTTEIEFLKKQMKDMQVQLTSHYQSQITGNAQQYQTKHDNISRELSSASIQKQKIKYELEGTKKQLIQSEINNKQLAIELQGLHQAIIKDVDLYRKQIENLKIANYELFHQKQRFSILTQNQQRKLQQSVKSSTILTQKYEQIVGSMSQIDKQLTDIHKIAAKLRQQRELFIKNYITLANRVAKYFPENGLNRDIEVIGQHFTEASLLHTELNRHLSKVKQIFNSLKGTNTTKLQKTQFYNSK